MNIQSTDQTAGNRLIDFVMRWPGWLMLVAIILTALAIRPASQLTFDQSIESLYAENDPRLLDYLKSKKWFGGDDFVFLAYTDPELMSAEGQAHLIQLTDLMRNTPGVDPRNVQSLSELINIGRNPFMRRHPERVIEFGRRLVVGDDNQTTALMISLTPDGQDGISQADTISRLRQIAAEQPFETFVVGEPVLIHDMFQYAEKDGARMGWAAAGVLSFVILIMLRDLRSVILPLIIVQMTVIWTKAVLALSGIQLTMVSSILASLVTIIGVSTVVYTSLFYRSLRESHDRRGAFRLMMQLLAIDIMWVCITTATGFSAQLTSHLHPVRSFGVTMVIGSLLVLAAMALVIPGGLLMGPERSLARHPRGESQITRFLLAVTEWVLHHRFLVWTATLVLLVISLFGLQRLRLETDFSKNFLASSPVRKSLDFMEERLGGAGSLEVNFPAPEELNDIFLDEVRELSETLRAIEINGKPGITRVLSASDGVDMIPRFPIITPTLQVQIERLNKVQPHFLPSLYSPEEGRMRIMLRAQERQSSEEKEQLIQQVTAAVNEKFSDANVTGLYVLMTNLIDSLVHDQWIDLLTSATGLICVMSIAYRSLKFGVISLIPNVLPMIMLLGGMGWLGVPVNIGTAMISSDAMGLTIHDSIFYLSAYRRARRSGLPFREALREVQTEVRRPLVYSNAALILGFLVLTTSNFVPLIYFGVLVSVAIAGGLVVNMILLPLLLELIDSPRRSQATPAADDSIADSSAQDDVTE
ncbi:efflux RND transporter permease subunit [Planctomicrobium sp. SH668]|uniref:efflux RND transporter permease subunit n=1 Tax=Planctomicrobium sp. SH668 TaxID=3448126 RepID=UPI003F5B7F39